MLKRTLFGLPLVLGLLLAACGGDDDGGQSPFDPNPTSAPENGGNDDGEDNGGGAATGDAGEVTLTTEPGQAVVVVDGETIEYMAAGSQSYRCEVGDDVLTINFQTAGGHNLLIQGTRQANGWVGNFGFKSADHENNVQFSGSIPANADSFGLGDNQLSFEGTVSRMEDFDPSTVEDLPATIAVNCASPGGDPMATIGGEDFVFPLSGAQSVTCDLSTERFEVRINRLAIDDLQLEAQGRQDGANWIGAMVIYAGDERYTSPLPQDGEGIEIDGSTLTYTGTFEATAGEESEGSLSVTCQ